MFSTSCMLIATGVLQFVHWKAFSVIKLVDLAQVIHAYDRYMPLQART